MTLYSKHLTIGLNVESSAGVPGGTTKEFRWREATFPNRPGNLVDQPNLGHEHMADTSDRPLTHSTRIDDGISITYDMRRSNGSDTNPLVTFLEAGGCNNVQGGTSGANDTISVYTSTTDFEVTADSSAIGSAGLVQLNNGLYWPTLTADYSTSPNAIVPSMGLPSASLATNDYYPTHCLIPGMGVEVASNKTLYFTQQTRAPHTATEDWNFTNAYCALSNFGPLVFEPGAVVSIPMSFHVGKVDDAAGALAASVFLDGEKTLLINDNCEFGFADANASGGIANTTRKFHRLEFTPGVNVVGNTSTGAGSVGDTSAYFADYEPATVKVVVDFSKDDYDQFQSETQTFKYMHLIQPTDDYTNIPAFGLWFPKCSLMQDGLILQETENWLTTELTYKLSSATYGSDTSNDSRGNAPWYFAFDQ
jgi:hypothetical protein